MTPAQAASGSGAGGSGGSVSGGRRSSPRGSSPRSADGRGVHGEKNSSGTGARTDSAGADRRLATRGKARGEVAAAASTVVKQEMVDGKRVSLPSGRLKPGAEVRRWTYNAGG